jgi:hypothetical protein
MWVIILGNTYLVVIKVLQRLKSGHTLSEERASTPLATTIVSMMS